MKKLGYHLGNFANWLVCWSIRREHFRLYRFGNRLADVSLNWEFPQRRKHARLHKVPLLTTPLSEDRIQ